MSHGVQVLGIRGSQAGENTFISEVFLMLNKQNTVFLRTELTITGRFLDIKHCVLQ